MLSSSSFCGCDKRREQFVRCGERSRRLHSSIRMSIAFFIFQFEFCLDECKRFCSLLIALPIFLLCGENGALLRATCCIVFAALSVRTRLRLVRATSERKQSGSTTARGIKRRSRQFSSRDSRLRRACGLPLVCGWV